MALDDIAAIIARTPADPDAESALCASFHHLLAGLDGGELDPDAVLSRLDYMIAVFEADPEQDRAALRRAQAEAMSAFGETDHYRRDELAEYLDERAITIQVNEDGALGEFWLPNKDLTPAAEIARAFVGGRCIGDVGAPNAPIWITPYTGEIEELCEEAREEFLPISRRAEISRRVVDVLGLCHVKPGDELIAMITKNSIADLLFHRPDDGEQLRPVAPTAIEARVHARFRQWPPPGLADSYGRTYALDKATRDEAHPPGSHGLPEGVRPRLPIGDFLDCIYLGTLASSDFDDPDATYLSVIGATMSAEAILRQLALVTGR